MVTNPDGWVGMFKLQPVQRYVRVGGDKNFREYVFTVQRNISFAWIHPTDVGYILSITKECCGGNKNPEFRLADEQHVRVWTGVAER